ncbi:MAG: Arm DNA-binding domain-containing protein [Proteobacteria bacterium]|nr:Arm DNA-binding domain-containing protein [Pseudomonadota bacterium]
MPLTDTAIRALKPEVRRYSRTDERGLVIEVFPTGGMLWHYRYRVNGKPERVTLGRYPARCARPGWSVTGARRWSRRASHRRRRSA